LSAYLKLNLLNQEQLKLNNCFIHSLAPLIVGALCNVGHPFFICF